MTDVPFYVTRRNADKQIAQWTVNAYVGTVVVLLVTINIIVWCFVGLYTAGKVVGTW